jgi:hypothetical protein
MREAAIRTGRRKEGSEKGNGGYSIPPLELESKRRRKRMRGKSKLTTPFERESKWPNAVNWRERTGTLFRGGVERRPYLSECQKAKCR